jgi:hypothetical protein
MKWNSPLVTAIVYGIRSNTAPAAEQPFPSARNALVNGHAQVAEPMEQYRDELGISVFIFSGCPSLEKSMRIEERVAPRPGRSIGAGATILPASLFRRLRGALGGLLPDPPLIGRQRAVDREIANDALFVDPRIVGGQRTRVAPVPIKAQRLACR